MKVKTSVSLSDDVLVALDALARDGKSNRSAVIEDAVWAYVLQRERWARNARDRAILDANAERINAEALDVLDYQTES
jgi:metal-responsive CopG/Arc/MetJ family transcriptional regulator